MPAALYRLEPVVKSDFVALFELQTEIQLFEARFGEEIEDVVEAGDAFCVDGGELGWFFEF